MVTDLSQGDKTIFDVMNSVDEQLLPLDTESIGKVHSYPDTAPNQ